MRHPQTSKKRAPGAGRKPLRPGIIMKRHTVRMADDEWDYCKAQGDASDFLRRLMAEHRARSGGCRVSLS